MQAPAGAGGIDRGIVHIGQNCIMHFSIYSIVCNAGLAVPEACTDWCDAELCFVSTMKLRHFAACRGEKEACCMSKQACEPCHFCLCKACSGDPHPTPTLLALLETQTLLLCISLHVPHKSVPLKCTPHNVLCLNSIRFAVDKLCLDVNG